MKNASNPSAFLWLRFMLLNFFFVNLTQRAVNTEFLFLSITQSLRRCFLSHTEDAEDAEFLFEFDAEEQRWRRCFYLTQRAQRTRSFLFEFDAEEQRWRRCFFISLRGAEDAEFLFFNHQTHKNAYKPSAFSWLKFSSQLRASA